MPRMKLVRFLPIAALLILPACASKLPKDAATLSMHLPASAGLPESRRIPLIVPNPHLTLEVDSFAVLTERDLDKVDLKGQGEEFLIRLVFNTHGTITLDSVSNNNRDEMLVVLINGRPVAAPRLKRRIVDGTFEFTPDLSREEAEKVVKGLNLAAEYYRKR